MEIVVTAFAAIVAAGCFLAIRSSDLKESGSQEDSSEGAQNNDTE